jgi:hypothetical protein
MALDQAKAQSTLSLQPTFRRIVELATLPPDWDSYGAEPLTARAIAGASLLITAVAEEQERTTGERRAPWTTAPIADGGLQVEWVGQGARIEVQVAPDGTLGYLIQRGDGEDARYQEADNVPFGTVLDRVGDLLRA